MDEISIIKLEILFNMEKQLAKACNLSNCSMAVFGSLFIIIFIGNFNQFLPIAGYLFWSKSQTYKDHNSKTLWLFFSLVITLTHQIGQQSNLIFIQLLQ